MVATRPIKNISLVSGPPKLVLFLVVVVVLVAEYGNEDWLGDEKIVEVVVPLPFPLLATALVLLLLLRVLVLIVHLFLSFITGNSIECPSGEVVDEIVNWPPVEQHSLPSSLASTGIAPVVVIDVVIVGTVVDCVEFVGVVVVCFVLMRYSSS